MEGMDLEAVKVEVRKNMALLNVAELTTLASELSVTVAPAKMGKLSGIFNVVSMHLMAQDDEEDDGRAVYEHASSILNRLLGARKPEGDVKPKEVIADQTADASSSSVSVATEAVTTVVPADGSGGLRSSAPVAQNNGASSNSSRGLSSGAIPVPYQRLRDFKITGGSVGGEDNRIDLTSVVFQVEEGRQAGYSER